jgi:hypothetical protein
MRCASEPRISAGTLRGTHFKIVLAIMPASHPCRCYCFVLSCPRAPSLLFLGCFRSRVLFQEESLVGFGEPSHAGTAYHDIHSFLETAKHIFLYVGHAVFGANGLNLWGAFLIGKHAEGREHVMFNLIVKPSMQKINHICSGAVNDTSQHLAQIKATVVGTTRVAESVNVGAGMIGNRAHETMNIGENVSQQ